MARGRADASLIDFDCPFDGRITVAKEVAMEVLILLIFLSAVIVAVAVLCFAWMLRLRTFDHSDRLALLPIQESDDYD